MATEEDRLGRPDFPEDEIATDQVGWNNPTEEVISALQVDLELSDRGGERIPISLVVDIFSNLQQVVNSLGNWIIYNKPKGKGQFPNDVRRACELEITRFELGSMHTTLTLSDSQRDLLGSSVGGRSIAMATDIIQIIENPESSRQEFYELIKDDRCVDQVLQNLYDLAPGDQSNYSLNITVDKVGAYEFTPNTKSRINSLKEQVIEPFQMVEFGHIRAVRYAPSTTFRLLTATGPITVKYDEKCKEIVRRYGDSIAQVKGIASLSSRGILNLEVKEPSDIIMAERIPVQDFTYLNRSIKLNSPILLDLHTEDGFNYLSNDEFKLLAEAENYKECVEIIKEQLSTLWEWFVDCPVEELGRSGLEFREKLIALED